MLLDGIAEGFDMLFRFDPEVWGPIGVSLSVSTGAILIASALALPLGLAIGLGTFRGRRAVISLLNTMLAMPTVLVGLVIYAFLSRRGPLGSWELLYTPTAMVIGQVVLALPILIALCSAAIERSDPRVRLTVLGLGAGRARAALGVALENRAALAAAVAAGFGRVFAEVGISMMVGGNIHGYTRNITTGIAFETGRGEFALGVALGVVLLVVALAVNFSAGYWQFRAGGKP